MQLSERSSFQTAKEGTKVKNMTELNKEFSMEMDNTPTDNLLKDQLPHTYKSKYQILTIVFIIALSNFFFGYNVVYFGQLDIDTMLEIFHSDIRGSLGSGILNGCIPVGALFGALSSSLLIRAFSRRNCLLVINTFSFIVGGLLYIQNFYTLIIFRFCQGISVGVYSALAPLIVKEISPVEIYGFLGAFSSFIGVLGVFFGCFFAFLLKVITGETTGATFWYYCFAFPQLVVLIQSFFFLFIFPYETPKYLLMVDKEDEARKLIEVLYKEEFVEKVLQQKKADLAAAKAKEQEAQQQVVKTEEETAKMNRSRIPIIIAIHLAALQQFSGCNAIAIYAGNITTGSLSLLMPSLVNLVQALGTFLTGVLLVRFGRKTILQFGCFMEAVANLMVAIGFLTSAGQVLVVIGLFLYMAMFSISLGPVVWLYIPQVVQPKIIPFSTATNWICASLVIFLFPVLTDDIFNNDPGVPFLFFAAWCGGSFIINQKFVIETKGKLEKDIQEEYSNMI